MSIEVNTKELEQLLDHSFTNYDLLREALTHPSLTRNEKTTGRAFNYERLEFLGDGVLGMVIAELLIGMYPHENEGALARRQAALVRGETLAKIGTKLGIGKYVLLAEGEEALGGRNNANTMENALEALIGALYLDGGLEPTKAFILKHWSNAAANTKEPPRDPKTILQEWAQSRGLAIPEYKTVSTKGPSHAPMFTIEVQIDGHDPATGTGTSKKAAEKLAARSLYDRIVECDD